MPIAEGTSKLLLVTVVCLTAITCAVIALKQRPVAVYPEDDLPTSIQTGRLSPSVVLVIMFYCIKFSSCKRLASVDPAGLE